MLNDLRLAIRAFIRRPAFAVVIVIALALGIGANATIFGIADAVLFRPLSFDRPELVVQISDQYVYQAGEAIPLTMSHFEDYRDMNTVMSHIAGFNGETLYLEAEGDVERVSGLSLSPDFFQMRPVVPVLGRLFLPDEEFQALPVVLISYRYWQTEFGASPDIVGTTLRFHRGDPFNNAPVTVEIVGVLPPEFERPTLKSYTSVLPAGTPSVILPMGFLNLSPASWDNSWSTSVLAELKEERFQRSVNARLEPIHRAASCP